MCQNHFGDEFALLVDLLHSAKEKMAMIPRDLFFDVNGVGRKNEE